ncbi:MAG: PD-(D/E)XK nuclease family protein [Acholeplasmataceae bacterium]
MDLTTLYHKINNSNNILIINDNLKRNIIKIKTETEIKQKKLYLFKVMGENELLDKLTFKELDELILREHALYKTPISIIKEKIKFAKYNIKNENNELKEFVERNQDLIIKSTFLNEISNYNLIFLEEPIYLKNILNFYKINYKTYQLTSNNIPLIKPFNYEEDEFYYCLNEISKLLEKGIDINKIFITGITSDNLYRFNNLTKQFKIPFNLNINNKLNEYKYTKDLLNLPLNLLIEKVKLPTTNLIKETINHQFINILNKYPLNKYDHKHLYHILKNNLANTNFPEPSYKNAVNLIELKEIPFLRKDEIVFILNARFENIPKSIKDNEYLSDINKDEINYPNSKKVNTFLRENAKNYLRFPNIKYISYSLNDYYNTYSKSLLLEEFLPSEIKLFKLNKNELVNSNAKEAYKIYFSNLFEEIPLSTFNNDFNVDYDEKLHIKNYIKNNFKSLTQSSLTTYLKSPFIFYLEYILKLSIFEERISIIIGNYFHDLMEVLFQIKYDLKTEVNLPNIKNKKQGIMDDFVNSNMDQPIHSGLLKDFYDVYFKEEINQFNSLKQRIGKNELLNNEETKLVHTLFFINKNKDVFLNSASLLIDLEELEPSDKIFVEYNYGDDKLFGRIDLVKLFKKEGKTYFSITDYKSSDKGALDVEKILNVFDALEKDKPISLSELDFIQLIFYAYLLNKINGYHFKDFGFITFMGNKNKVNVISYEDFPKNKNYFTFNNKRSITEEGLNELYEKFENLTKNILNNIYEANFNNIVLKTKQSREKLENGHFKKYQGIAFYGSELDLDEDENEY